MQKEIIALQCRISEQEKTIDELSHTVLEQWKMIDIIQKKLDHMTMRFLDIEEQMQSQAPITKPPHY